MVAWALLLLHRLLCPVAGGCLLLMFCSVVDVLLHKCWLRLWLLVEDMYGCMLLSYGRIQQMFAGVRVAWGWRFGRLWLGGFYLCFSLFFFVLDWLLANLWV